MRSHPHHPSLSHCCRIGATGALTILALIGLSATAAGAASLSGPPAGQPAPPRVTLTPCELAIVPCTTASFTFTHSTDHIVDLTSWFPQTPKGLSNKITAFYDMRCDDGTHVTASLKPIAANAPPGILGLRQDTQLLGPELGRAATTSCTITQTLWGTWVTNVQLAITGQTVTTPDMTTFATETVTFTNTKPRRARGPFHRPA
jgi:hypothetical protein